MACTCKIGPGKFEGEPAATFMAWEQAMLGNSDATTGSEDTMTEWLRSPLNLDADQEVVKATLAYGYCQECVEGAGQDIRGGVAVWETSHGFVGMKVFDTREEFDAGLAQAMDEDAASYVDEEER